jgi:YD repeat-containing protein
MMSEAGTDVRPVPIGTYGYDARGDLISDTDWNGNTGSFHYNAHGLRIRSTWPDGSVQSAVSRPPCPAARSLGFEP